MTVEFYPPVIPKELTCDNCSATPGGLWMYPMSEFRLTFVDRLIIFETGFFGLCDRCRDCVEAVNINTLIRAAIAGNDLPPYTARYLRKAIILFMQHRTGPATYGTER